MLEVRVHPRTKLPIQRREEELKRLDLVRDRPRRDPNRGLREHLPRTWLAFLVVIPKMDFDGEGVRADVGRELDTAARKLWPYRRATLDVEKDEHVYQMGLQHRRQEDGAHWRPTKVSQVFWFANDHGAAKYAFTDAMRAEIKARFDW